MGVAGGNGLVCLCKAPCGNSKEPGIEIVLTGFDTGAGLPTTQDARDLLYCWPSGSFEMDKPALERRNCRARRAGDWQCRTNGENWNPRPDAPLGVAIFDLDLYSSTAAALPLLTRENVLPEYGVIWMTSQGIQITPIRDGIGVRAAVVDFNAKPETRHHARSHHAGAYLQSQIPEGWHQQIYVYHRLGHPNYNTCLSQEKHQLSLTA